MRQWIGLIVVLGAAYYAWTQFGAQLIEKNEPATPEVGWYLDEIDHHFSIVPERGGAWFFRGFHENKTKSFVGEVRVEIFVRNGKEWDSLTTFRLGSLESEQRNQFDLPIRVPAGMDEPKLRWEIVDVRLR